MIQDIVSLTQKLIAIKSTPDNTQALNDAVQICLAELKGFTIEHFEHKGVKSILVYNTPKRPKKFKIILNGHLDIIPGKEHQYTPVTKDNRIYGVAAMDMKSSVAAFIVVFKEVATSINYPLALQFVTDEELGGFNSTMYQINKGVRADFVIAGETTNFTIENETKGVFWAKVSTKGKTAHGAHPWKGENAIRKMTAFLSELEQKYPVPSKPSWVTTVNIGSIQTTNKTFNKVPDDCEVWLDIRYIPQETKTIVQTIKNLLPKGFKFEILLKEPAQFVDANNDYIKLLQRTGKRHIKKQIPLISAQGSSDARHYTRVGCDAIEFGPIGKGMGSDNEWVSIPSLEKYAVILKDFLITLSK